MSTAQAAAVALTLGVTSALLSQAPPAATPPLALTNATLVDAASNSLRRNQVVLIEDERITAIFPGGSRPIPPGTQTVNLAGKYLIPGLIDTHIHPRRKTLGSGPSAA
jgi:adenine deaminase